MINTKNIVTAIIISAFLIPTIAQANTHKVKCSTQSITQKLNGVKPGDVVEVSGTCVENLVIPADMHNVTFRGNGTATIEPADPTQDTIRIRGSNIRIIGFTIKGGRDAVHVHYSGDARLANNTIINSTRDGVIVHAGASVRVLDSTVANNGRHGVTATESSSLRVGINRVGDTFARPNIIENNGREGVISIRSSNARVIGNTIRNNGRDGIRVDRNAHADIRANAINSNGRAAVQINVSGSIDLTGRGYAPFPDNTGINPSPIRCFHNSAILGDTTSLGGLFTDGSCF